MAIISTSIAKEMELLREKEEALAKAKLSSQEKLALEHYQQQLAQSSAPQSMTMSKGLRGLYGGLSYPQAYMSSGNYYASGSGSSPLATVSGTHTTTGNITLFTWGKYDAIIDAVKEKYGYED